jgi:hypothetical protein
VGIAIVNAALAFVRVPAPAAEQASVV